MNVGDLLVFLSLLTAGVGYVIHQDSRSAKTEVEVITLKETDTRHEKDIKELKVDLMQKMDRMESKVDRIMERQVRR